MYKCEKYVFAVEKTAQHLVHTSAYDRNYNSLYKKQPHCYIVKQLVIKMMPGDSNTRLLQFTKCLYDVIVCRL